MELIIQINENVITLKNENEILITRYFDSFIGIFYDYRSNIHFLNITIENLDKFIERYPENVLISNTEYIKNNKKKLKNIINDISFDIDINNTKIIIENSNIYFGNKLKINKYFKSLDIKSQYHDLEKKLILYKTKYKSIKQKYTNLIKITKDIDLINKYTSIINIVDKAIYDLLNSNLFTDLEDKIQYIENEDEDVENLLLISNKNYLRKFDEFLLKNKNECEYIINKYIEYIINKYKLYLIDFNYDLKYFNIIENFHLYQNISKEFYYCKRVLNRISTLIDKFFIFDENHYNELDREYDEIMYAMSENNSKNLNYSFLYFDKKIKENCNNIINYKILVKNIYQIIDNKVIKYKKKYEDCLDIYFRNKSNIYNKIINNNFNIEIIQKYVRDIFANYNLIFETMDNKNSNILKKIELNLNEDYKDLVKVKNNINLKLNDYSKKIDILKIQEQLLKYNKKEILFDEIQKQINIKKNEVNKINIENKMLKTKEKLKEFENQNQNKINIDNKNIESDEKELKININQTYNRVQNIEISESMKRRYLQYLYKTKQINNKNIPKKKEKKYTKKKDYKKYNSFRKTKTLTIW